MFTYWICQGFKKIILQKKKTVLAQDFKAFPDRVFNRSTRKHLLVVCHKIPGRKYWDKEKKYICLSVIFEVNSIF